MVDVRGDVLRPPHGTTPAEKLKCKFCKVLCSRTDFLKRHIAEKHNQSNASVRQFACKHCDLMFPNYDGLIHHPLVPKQTGGGKPSKKKSQGKQPKPNDNSNKSTNRRNNATIDSGALQDGVLNRALRPVDEEKYDLLLIFANVKPIVIQFLQSRIEQEQGIKWYLSTQFEMYKENPDDTVETNNIKSFKSNENIHKKEGGWLVVLRLNVPVNNFSVMSGRSHRFLGN